MSERNVPIEPGLYLAKSSEDYNWWNCLVYIYGTVPYLRWHVWVYRDNILRETIDITFLTFGPKIAQPERLGMINLVPIQENPIDA